MVELQFKNENGSILEQTVPKSMKLKYINRYKKMGFKLIMWSNR